MRETAEQEQTITRAEFAGTMGEHAAWFRTAANRFRALGDVPSAEEFDVLARTALNRASLPVEGERDA